MSGIVIGWTAQLTDGREDVECDVFATVSGRYTPAKLTGPWETCHPAEYPDLEIDRVVVCSTGENVASLLTPECEKTIVDALWEEWDESRDDYS